MFARRYGWTIDNFLCLTPRQTMFIARSAKFGIENELYLKMKLHGFKKVQRPMRPKANRISKKDKAILRDIMLEDMAKMTMAAKARNSDGER